MNSRATIEEYQFCNCPNCATRAHWVPIRYCLTVEDAEARVASHNEIISGKGV